MKKQSTKRWISLFVLVIMIMQLMVTTAFAAEPAGKIEPMLLKKCDPPVITSSVANGNDKTDISGTGKPGYKVNIILLDRTVKTQNVGNDGKWKFEGINNIQTGENLFVYQSTKGKLDSEYAFPIEYVIFTIGNEKFIMTNKQNIYEVLDMSGHSKNPREYIFDLNNSIQNSILDGDEVRFGSDIFDRLGETYQGYYWRGTGEDKKEFRYINEYPALVDSNGNVILDAVNFPDSGLLDVIKSAYDTSNTGKVDSDVVISLNINANNGDTVSDLTGIEIFPELTNLVVAYQPNLTNVNVTSNTKLTVLNLSGNTNVDTLNINGLVNLNIIHLTQTKIYSIDLSDCNKLSVFSCQLQEQACSVIWPKNPENRIDIGLTDMSTLNNADMNKITISDLHIYGSNKNNGGVLLTIPKTDINSSISMVANNIAEFNILSVNSGLCVLTFKPDGTNNVFTSNKLVLGPIFDGTTPPQKAYMVKNGVTVTKGATLNGSTIEVAAGGIVFTGNGYYVLTNGGEVTSDGVITSNGAGLWKPVHMTANTAISVGTPVDISAGTLTNHR